MKKILAIIICAVTIVSCAKEKKGDLVVTGKVENSANQKIGLLQANIGEEPRIVDTSVIKVDGTFELKTKDTAEHLYAVVLQSGKDFIFINDADKIELNINPDQPKNYVVKGSKGTEELLGLMRDLTKKDSAIGNLFEQQQQQVTDSAKLVHQTSLTNLQKERNEGIVKFIEKTGSPVAAGFALSFLDSEIINEERQKALITDLLKKFPGNSTINSIKAITDNVAQQQPAQGSGLMGQTAPEISMNSIDGSKISLSDYKGKYVLVDFWASWCGPCRGENPNVVAAYNKFKNKNFDILGVSLDENKDAWEAAVKADGLTWKHISDLKRWQSPVVETYQIRGIPFNVLVDPNGKIIAYDLRGEALHNKLNEVLK